MLKAKAEKHEKTRRPEVTFETDAERGLEVQIWTEGLTLRSVKSNETDLAAYFQLYGDKQVMEKFATGETKDNAYVKGRIGLWTDRWKKKIPFSSLAVEKRDEDDAIIGQVVLGFGEEKGSSELAYLFKAKNWGQHIGTEAVSAVVQEYAPEVSRRGYKINGQPFEKVVATARPDNPGSWKILEKTGMSRVRTEEKHGAIRYQYEIEVNKIRPS